MIDGTPEVMLFAADFHKHFVQIVGVTEASVSSLQAMRKFGAEFVHPPVQGCANVRCEKGNSKDVDLYMQGTWDPADARQVYPPDWLDEQAKNPTPQPEDPNMAIEGDMERLPPWIIEFHNRLAPYTA